MSTFASKRVLRALRRALVLSGALLCTGVSALAQDNAQRDTIGGPRVRSIHAAFSFGFGVSASFGLDLDLLSSRSNDVSAVGVRAFAEELIIGIGHGFLYGATVRYTDGNRTLRVDALAGLVRESGDGSEWSPWVSAELRYALLAQVGGLMLRFHYRPAIDTELAVGFLGLGMYAGWDVAR